MLHVRTWGRWLFDGPIERDPLSQILPPFLSNSEQGRVVWLMLIEVVDDYAKEQLQTKVHSKEHIYMKEDFHILRVYMKLFWCSWHNNTMHTKLNSSVSPR